MTSSLPAQGGRFTTKDKTFRKWTRVEPDFVDCNEAGGQCPKSPFSNRESAREHPRVFSRTVACYLLVMLTRALY